MTQPAPLTFAVGPESAADFMHLPEAERDRLRNLLAALKTIHECESKVAGAKNAAAVYCHLRGFSASALLRSYRRYTAKGDWRVLVMAYYSPRLSVRCTGDNGFIERKGRPWTKGRIESAFHRHLNGQG
jgi:hypothetical protein